MTYDCFTYNGEKDILEIRMAILDPYVDKFVICESRQTFSGKRKPIYYKGDNDKVIHLIAPDVLTGDAFERAFRQKEFIKTALKDCADTDIIYYGDVDEIFKPQEITDDKVYNLEQLNYCYYLNNRSSEEWVGTIVGRWGSLKNGLLRDFRANHDNVLPNGGWHFTNQGGANEIRRKLESYDHQEFNDDLTKKSIEERMINGKDYVGRATDWKGKPFEFWIDWTELPQYLLDNQEKYARLFA